MAVLPGPPLYGMPNPLCGGHPTWLRDVQVLIARGPNVWLFAFEATASDETIVAQLRSVLDLPGVVVDRIEVHRGGRPPLPGPVVASKPMASHPGGWLGTAPAAYALVSFAAANPLWVGWPVWSVLNGYCPSPSPAFVLEATTVPVTPGKPPPAPPPPAPRPTAPAPSVPTAPPPAAPASPEWGLIAVAVAGVAVVGMVVYLRWGRR